MYRHFLIPMDGSERSEMAARQGVDLAKALGARITAFHVMPAFPALNLLEGSRAQFQESATARGEAILGFAQEVAHLAGVSCALELASSGDTFRAIIALAEREDCDLIVMASHGRQGIEGVLLGSVTQKVLTHSHLPVLVIR